MFSFHFHKSFGDGCVISCGMRHINNCFAIHMFDVLWAIPLTSRRFLFWWNYNWTPRSTLEFSQPTSSCYSSLFFLLLIFFFPFCTAHCSFTDPWSGWKPHRIGKCGVVGPRHGEPTFHAARPGWAACSGVWPVRSEHGWELPLAVTCAVGLGNTMEVLLC